MIKKSHSAPSAHRAPQLPPGGPFAQSQSNAVAQAQSAQSAAIASTQQCEAEKMTLQQSAQHQVDENKRVVGLHNNIAANYNDMLKKHKDLVSKFNQLVSELQDPSTAEFLARKAIKAYQHPGIEGAVNKTKIYVLPVAQQALIDGQLRGSAWLNSTQSKVQDFLEESFGADDNWVPAMSGWIVYGSVIIPITIALWCVMEFVCKLDKMLLFGNVYLTMFALSLSCFALFTGDDPLSTFAEQDATLYQFAQCAFALMFVLFGVISFVAWCTTPSGCRLLNFIVLLSFGIAYYILVWTPAMIDELPTVDELLEGFSQADDTPRVLVAAPYLVLTLVFSVMLFGESCGATDPGRDQKKNDDRSD